MEQQIPANITLLTAFVAGLLSFLSPCVLPLIPGYISFISGASLQELTSHANMKELRKDVLQNSLFFVLGFSAVFIALGASATFIGRLLLQYLKPASILAGALIIIVGVHMTGLIRIPFLYQEKRFHTVKRSVSETESFLVGLAFAFGWTPCIGPILAGILAIAGEQKTVSQGIILLAVYSLGLAIPFMLAAYSMTFFFKWFDKIKKHLNMIEIISGVLLVIIGILIMTGGLSKLATYLGMFNNFAK